MEDIIIGVDLAKRIFQLHGATGSGELLFRKRLRGISFGISCHATRQVPLFLKLAVVRATGHARCRLSAMRCV